MAFNKDDLVAGFTRALMENKDKVNLVFPGDLIRGGQGYDRITSIPLTSIRDALQYHGVDTNALARKVFRETFDREEEDKKLKPSGRIVPRTPDEVLQEATNEIDCSGFIHKFYLGSGVNEPEVYEDPKDGKLYVLKHLDSRRSPTDDQRATDQEIATLAYYRAMGINANVACRGFIKNQDGERTDYIVTPYITSSSTLEDWRTMSAYPDITSEGNRVVKGVTNGLIADLFLDHIDGPFNQGNVVIDSDGNPVRIDGGGGLLWDASPEEGLKHETDRYSYGGFGDRGDDGDEDQQWLRDIADTEGSFEGQGIEFGLDYFLNPNGWHWNPGNVIRKNMLKSTDYDQLKNQAEELLLNNMTPDKIDQVSRIIRNPYDRAKVVDALNYRRKEILKHFGIEDTYDPQTADITNGVPSEHSLDEYFETVESLRLNLTNDQYKELIDFASKTDITQGQLSSKLQEIRSQQDLFNGNEKSAEQLIKETKKNLEKGLEEAKPDDSDFPTNGKVEESEISAVSPMRYESRMLRYGDVVLDRKASVVGRVVFSNSLPEGKTYVGLIDGNGNFVEKTFDYNEPVWIDVSPKSREELSYNTGQVPAPAILNRLRARSNQVLEDVKAVYPDAKVLPNGDLIIASTEKRELTRRQRLFKYDVVVHRTPDEKFVTYVRRTELGDDRLPVGTPQVGRISVETHSSRHLLNRIAPLLRGKGNYKGILADQPHNWFSNSSDLQGEVLHPSTGQPIPFSLAPRNLNTQYIGDTGIEVTGDPIKDALISHVADLIDRGVSASEVLGRLNNQTVLNKNQVADIAERIQANRVFPGVNQIPYVSRDGSNIVRVGDRVRHFHPDGTIREGRVYRREPLIVNKKAPGDYGYTDVLRVRFDDGTYSPIVAKNLEILARSDGSSPDLGNAPAPRIPTAFRDPVGLPSNFRVKDAEFGRREFNHSEGSDSHSSGVVLPMSRGTNNEFFVAAVYGKGGSHGRSLPLDTFETKDKNLAQDWLVAKMAALEESYSGDNKIEGRKLQQGIDPFSSPEDLEEAMQRDALSFGAGLENAVERTGESRVISKSQRKEMFSDTVYESSSEEFPDVLDENGNVTTPARTITTMKMVKVKGKDGKYISDEKLPVVQYIEEKVSGKKQVKYFLNRKTFDDGKDYKSKKYTAAKQKENILPVIDKFAKLRVVYDESGPHIVRLGGSDIEVPFEDYVALRKSKMTDKKIGDPTEGEPLILPEYIKEWESILKNTIGGVESRAEKEGTSDDKYGGKPYILYIGGMAGAGKTSGLFKKDKNGKVRVRDKEDDEGRDPEGVERPGLPVIKQFDSDGNVTEETKGLEKYEAVLINPDDIKTQLSEVRDMQARMRLERVEGSGVSRITRGKVKDESWASESHEESSLLTKLITREAMRLKLDIIIDGVGDDTVEKLVKKVDVAKEKGYFTIGEYLDADWRRALISASERAKAVYRVVPEDVLAKGAIGLAAMQVPQKQADGTTPRSILSGVFDRFFLFGNGESSRRPQGVDTRDEAAVMLGYSEGDGEFIPNDAPLAADMLAASRSRNSLLAPRKDKNMNEIIEELLTRMKQIKKEKQRTSTATKLISKEDTKDLSPEQKNHVREVNAIQSVAAQTGLTPQQLMLIPGVGNALNMYSSGNITIEDILNLVISNRNKQ